MKKFLMYLALVMLATMMVATGCSKTPVDATTTTAGSALSDTDAATESSNSPSDISLAMICEDYLGVKAWEGAYYQEKEGGFISVSYTIYSPCTSLVCPRAVYNSVDWTVDEIVESWQNQTAPWVTQEDIGGYDDIYFLWSPDYRYCFTVDDGWLLINGVKTWLMGPIADSLDPADLVKDFQSGKWDGSKIYSADGATCAEVLYDGEIFYSYEAFAYGNYDLITTQAWNNSGGSQPEISFRGEELAWGRHDMESSYLPDGRLIYSSTTAQLPSGVNVHFPGGYLSDMLCYTTFGFNEPTETKVYTITNSGVFCYQAGQILDSWPCDIEFDPTLNYTIWSESIHGNNDRESGQKYYAQLGDKVIELGENGEIFIKLENIIKTFMMDGYVVGHMMLADGKLSFNSKYGSYFSEQSPIIISNQVVDYYVSPYLDAVIFSNRDGYTHAIAKEELYDNAAGNGPLWFDSLSTESPAFYAAKYLEYYAEHRNAKIAYQKLLDDYANLKR